MALKQLKATAVHSSMTIVALLCDAIAAINTPRLFETERGYQGALLTELSVRLHAADLPPDSIAEIEYQKRQGIHGSRIRPDILIHVPAAAGGNRRLANTLACELKLSARAAEAKADFRKLDELCRTLDYSVVAFVNINSANTYGDLYDGPFSDRIHFFATQLRDGQLQVHHSTSQRGTQAQLPRRAKLRDV